MDILRRGAMVKAGRLLLGGAGAATMAGRGHVAASLPVPEKGPPRRTGASERTADPFDFGPPKVDPDYEARSRAAAPLQAEMDRVEGYGVWRSSTTRYDTSPYNYQSALRSTSHHWRASVNLDREKARRKLMDTLRSEIDKVLQSPIMAINRVAQDAMAAFMAEINKP